MSMITTNNGRQKKNKIEKLKRKIANRFKLNFKFQKIKNKYCKLDSFFITFSFFPCMYPNVYSLSLLK